MKKFNKSAAQGELFFRKVEKLPNDLTENKATNGKHIVGHSETGHHHTMDADSVKFFGSTDPMVSFMEVLEPTTLKHERSFDTHEPMFFDVGVYEIRHQRESAPEGWQKVVD